MESTGDPFALESFGFTRAERERLTRWLEVNDSFWQRYLQGVNKDYWWWRWEEEVAPACVHWVDHLSIRLATLRMFCYVSRWRALMAFEQGDFYHGFLELVVPIRAGRHLMSNACALEKLVGMGLVQYTAQQIIAILTFIDDEQIASQLHDFLNELNDVAVLPSLDLRGRKMEFLSAIQQSFTPNGLGQGRLTVYALESYDRKMTPLQYLFREENVLRRLRLHAGRNDTQRLGCELLDKAELQFSKTPYELHSGGGKFLGDEIHALTDEKWGLVRDHFRDLGRQYKQYHRMQALMDATRIILALRVWYLEYGTYPEGLSLLVEEKYLEDLPIDPYSSDVFRYERQADDFVLYSLGADFDDDGGVQTEDGRGGEDELGGDSVFWPVQAW